jgi:integrase
MTLGYGPDVQSVHGFRATARTLLAEELNIDPLVIEAQLAHAVKDANGRAYNRTQYLKHRGHDAAMGRLFGQAGTGCRRD